MEATNISINKQSSVSSNVETLQAIKQRVLLLIKQHCNVGTWSLPRLYRQELRMARAVAAWCDRHSTLMTWLTAIQVVAFTFYMFLFA